MKPTANQSPVTNQRINQSTISMRVLLFILLSIVFIGCNSNDQSAKDNNGDSTATKPVVSEPHALKASEIPASLSFRGKPDTVLAWTDKNGENILITSLVAPFIDNGKDKNSEEENAYTAELHAFQYVKKDTGYQLLWKISDAEKQCAFDIGAAFIKNAASVTDLDSNGIAETTLLYKLACRSDVSPATFKLIMHENAGKFALRGNTWIKTSDEDVFTVNETNVALEKLPRPKDEFEQWKQAAGRYETEKEFSTAPPVFLTYARQQWLKFVKETFE